MPAIPFPVYTPESNLVQRSTNAYLQNATDSSLAVVCAWPVSGQYGPGTRVLYDPCRESLMSMPFGC